MKFVPLTVRVSVWPEVPETGVTLVIVGIGLTILNPFTSDELPPPGAAFVTETVRGPLEAVGAIANRAVIWVLLRTLASDTLISGPALTVVTPTMNPEPVRVTFTVPPLAPLSGVTREIEGTGLTIVKADERIPDPPPGPVFTTVTSLKPGVAAESIAILAVRDVGLTNVVETTLTPLPNPALLVSWTKFVPVSVTSSIWPIPPLVGETAVTVGVGFVTLNMADVDAVPPPGAGLVTDTVRAPSTAPAAMVICAVSDAAFVTETDVTVIPLPKATVVRPFWNPVPWRVTASDCPLLPVAGDALKSVGVGFGGTWTSNAWLNVAVPPEVVTETSLFPAAAPAAIVMPAVICAAEMNVVELTVIPVPLKPTVVPPLTKFVPLSVTVSD